MAAILQAISLGSIFKKLILNSLIGILLKFVRNGSINDAP